MKGIRTMKKERIEITKSNNQIHFYLAFEGNRHWLFSQEYSLSVYDYFRFGRSVKELREHKYLRNNPRLAKTMERILSAVKYIRKEYEIPEYEGKRRYYRSTCRDLYAL